MEIENAVAEYVESKKPEISKDDKKAFEEEFYSRFRKIISEDIKSSLIQDVEILISDSRLMRYYRANIPMGLIPQVVPLSFKYWIAESAKSYAAMRTRNNPADEAFKDSIEPLGLEQLIKIVQEGKIRRFRKHPFYSAIKSFLESNRACWPDTAGF